MAETDLDLTSNPAEAAASARGVADPAIAREPYDPARDREKVRGWIALALLILMVLIVLLLLVGFLVGAVAMDDLHKLAAVILSPVVGLFGAVIGFYYGEQSRRR